jgi:hypothetical protein
MSINNHQGWLTGVPGGRARGRPWARWREAVPRPLRPSRRWVITRYRSNSAAARSTQWLNAVSDV